MEKYKWEVDKIYSTTEMQQLMGISKSTWDHKRNVYLDNFSLYYDYEVIYEGTKTNYHILKQLGDYKKPPNKRDKVIRDKTYSEEIISVVYEDRLQTAKNVSRIIKDHEPIIAFNHTEGTVYEYTRLRMRSLFGTVEGAGGTVGGIMEKQWCWLDKANNCYETMSDKLVQKFFSYIKQEKAELTEKEAELYNDYEIGLITREEMQAQIGNMGFSAFLTAKQKFKADYGFTPIKVPTYGFYDEDILDFERNNKAAQGKENIYNYE